MAEQRKTIITAAITGAIHTPSMSDYLPTTPQQIIDDAVKAYEAGAAVVHIHARNPETRQPSSDIDIYREIVSGIKKRCNVVICVTTGGGLGMSLEQRIATVPALKPEIASCNAGSIDFVLTPAADTIKQPKYDWEIPYLRNTWDMVFANTFKGIEFYVKTMYEQGTCPEFEVYDVGMINNIAYLRSKGIIKNPVYIQFVMGILGGIPATIENLAFMLKTANDLLGAGTFNWSCAAAGRHQFTLTTAALGMGGHVRVGLEDNLYLRKGVLAKSSGEQVAQLKEIMTRLSIEAASPDEARKILGLKGIAKVAY
jgi:uncharacterized protein (DUF849 family)